MNDLRSMPGLDVSVRATPRLAFHESGILQGSAGPVAVREIAKGLLFLARYQDEAIDHVRFGDPAWIALVTLFVASHDGKTVSVTELRDLMDIPMSSAQRLVQNLLSIGHIRREQDTADGRRFNLVLEQTAEIALKRQLGLLSPPAGTNEDIETRIDAQ